MAEKIDLSQISDLALIDEAVKRGLVDDWGDIVSPHGDWPKEATALMRGGHLTDAKILIERSLGHDWTNVLTGPIT